MRLNLAARPAGRLLLAAMWACGLSALQGQPVSSLRVYTKPPGAQFSVDGQVYTGQAVFLWPAGSKHFLSAQPVHSGQRLNTRYILTGWETNLGVPISVSPITADPALTDVWANFELQYAVMLRYFSCGANTTDCPGHSPGRVSINGNLYTQDATLYLPAGSTVNVQAYPNPEYVFTGWSIAGAGAGNSFLTSFVLNQPYSVTPYFQPARPLSVGIETSPPGLQVLVDRTPMTSPAQVEWGYGTTHALGAEPVQQDQLHRLWVFDSWSDGGAINHAYTVPAGSSPIGITARYVPGAAVSFLTSPPGLSLSIDGRTDWSGYNFVWAGGATHAVSAPAEQTDAQGRKYRFQSWSNGGPAAQQVTMPSPPAAFRLTATYEVVGQLTLASLPSGLTLQVDGAACVTPCQVERAVGAPVEVGASGSLAAGPGSRLDLIGWADGGPARRTLTAAGDPQVWTARYQLRHQLRLLVDPPEGALAIASPASPDGYYDAQAQVDVVLQLRPGYTLRGWDGDLTGRAMRATLAMQGPRTLRALLEAVPYVADGAVQNGAGQTPLAAVAAGSVASVFGLHLAPAAQAGPANPLAQTIAGVTVRMGERLLPLFFVSPGQINLQLPSDLDPGPHSLTVEQPGQPDVKAEFTVARRAPGLFHWEAGERSYALAEHEDGSLVTAEAPARPGELLTLYTTGLGAYDHSPPDGFALPGTPAYLVADPVEVQLGGESVPAESAAGACGKVGLQAVRFRLQGAGVSGAALEIRVRVQGVQSNAAILPVVTGQD